MNIRIPDSWLTTLLETDKNPHFIAEKLSLSGPSVEKVEEIDGDFVYSIEVTSNRSDAFSVLGVAREIYATFKFQNIAIKLKLPEGINFAPKLETRELPLKVKIEKPQLCPRFTAVILDNVKIKPSPSLLQKQLELSGIRALNNVVDISNYLMLELGQPAHTFDYDKIRKAAMILRESADGEEIITLDGQKRRLAPRTIVIEDEGRLIDLCGIMGAANSQIDAGTRRVLLFVQTYNPVRIRKTSNDLGLRTEASTRFEKGIDAEGAIAALNRAVWLLKVLAGAKIASKVIDIYPAPYKTKEVKLRKKKLDQYMGIEVPLTTAGAILESLGFEVTIGSGQIRAKVPSFRAGDVEIEEDLIEEIARISQFDKIPNLLPTGEIRPQTSNIFYWEDRVKDYLKYQGLTEIYTNSMISKSDLERVSLDLKEALKIRNPLNLDLEYLRPTLLPSLLRVVASNQAKGEKLRFFELANRYIPTVRLPSGPKEGKLPSELLSLAGILQAGDFYALKGILEGLFDDLGINATFSQGSIPNFVPEQTAQITSDQKVLGRMGKIDLKVTGAFGIDSDVFVFGLDFANLALLAKTTKQYVPVSKYPTVEEDISMIVDEREKVDRILEVIQKAAGSLLKRTKVFDIFYPSTGPKLGKNKKSVAVHLTYQSQTHNLTSKEVVRLREKIMASVEKELAARVRLKES